MASIEIGRLLRAGTSGFIAGCSVSQFEAPAFGSLVRAPITLDYDVYGIINDIHIDDDGLVRQLVTSDYVSAEVMRDNRERRIVPVEMSVISVGYRLAGSIHHLLPPRPPLSLDILFLCSDAELAEFTSAGRGMGYFRHLLRASDAPVGEMLAAHIQLARAAHGKSGQEWTEAAIKELITLLRDDYPTLMSVLGALGEVFI